MSLNVKPLCVLYATEIRKRESVTHRSIYTTRCDYTPACNFLHTVSRLYEMTHETVTLVARLVRQQTYSRRQAKRVGAE
jgi:hypothetical protein